MPQIQLKDFKMHYVERGTGPEPVVFVHGFISTRRWWLPTMERLERCVELLTRFIREVPQRGA